MRHILILSTLLLSACSPYKRQGDPRTIHGVNPAFRPYISEYLNYKGRPMYWEIPMQFADLSGNIVGLCTRWSSGYRQIQVDKDYWDSTDEGHRIELIAHELGHCDLGRDHVSATNAIGDPVSVMYPYVFGLYSNDDFTYYMNELFHPHASTIESPSIELGCVLDIQD